MLSEENFNQNHFSLDLSRASLKLFSPSLLFSTLFFCVISFFLSPIQPNQPPFLLESFFCFFCCSQSQIVYQKRKKERKKSKPSSSINCFHTKSDILYSNCSNKFLIPYLVSFFHRYIFYDVRFNLVFWIMYVKHVDEQKNERTKEKGNFGRLLLKVRKVLGCFCVEEQRLLWQLKYQVFLDWFFFSSEACGKKFWHKSHEKQKVKCVCLNVARLCWGSPHFHGTVKLISKPTHSKSTQFFILLPCLFKLPDSHPSLNPVESRNIPCHLSLP